MIYLRLGGWPQFWVLVHDGPASDAEVFREIAASMPRRLELETALGSLVPAVDGDVEYLYVKTDVPIRQRRYMSLSEIMLSKRIQQRFGLKPLISYNERAGSRELLIAPPAPDEDCAFLGTINNDTFVRLREWFLEGDRILDGEINDGTISNAAELLRLARTWSRTAYEDAVIVLMTAIARRGYHTFHDYLRQLGIGESVGNDFRQSARSMFESFSLLPKGAALTSAYSQTRILREYGRVAWLCSAICARVCRYLSHEDLTPEELLDLLAQEAPEGYELERVLSTNSAFKIVYLATDDRGRTVVLKRYKWGPDQMADLAARLATSPARMIEKDTLTDWMGEVRHSHIQPCMLIRNRSNEPFILEPRLEATFETLLSHRPGQDELERLFAQLVEAVAYLHEHGIVHTDIKPDNVGIRNREAVLLDFGIATVESGTKKGNPGSLKTRAPELFGTDVSPTPASDAWALGATAFALASGGHYPLIAKEELRMLPKADDPSRRDFEILISERIETYRSNPDALEEHLRSVLSVHSGVLQDVVLAACRFDPRERATAGTLFSYFRRWT